MTIRNAASMGTFGSTWEHGGYSGKGNVAPLLGSLSGRGAIICGNGEGVFEELRDALTLIVDPVIFGVNDVGMYLPKMDHWVSLHPDNLAVWRSVRWLTPQSKDNLMLHSVDPRAFIDYTWEGLTPLFALSGYFAMQIAYLMGAEQIILCGCPGSKSRRFFDMEPKKNFSYGDGTTASDEGVREQLEREMNRLPEFKAKVRSMWGWTRAYFGPPKRGV